MRQGGRPPQPHEPGCRQWQSQRTDKGDLLKHEAQPTVLVTDVGVVVAAELDARPPFQALPHEVGQPQRQCDGDTGGQPRAAQVATTHGRSHEAGRQPQCQRGNARLGLQAEANGDTDGQPPARVGAARQDPHHQQERKGPPKLVEHDRLEQPAGGEEQRRGSCGERRQRQRPPAATELAGDGRSQDHDRGVDRAGHQPQWPQMGTGDGTDRLGEQGHEWRLIDVPEGGMATGRQVVELVAVEPVAPAQCGVEHQDAGSDHQGRRQVGPGRDRRPEARSPRLHARDHARGARWSPC
jgi:hypothetical protein